MAKKKNSKKRSKIIYNFLIKNPAATKTLVLSIQLFTQIIHTTKQKSDKRNVKKTHTKRFIGANSDVDVAKAKLTFFVFNC